MFNPEIGLQIFVRRAESPIYNSPMATPWGNRQTHRMCALKGQCTIQNQASTFVNCQLSFVNCNCQFADGIGSVLSFCQVN
jgi:hypothetical protein